MGLTIEFTTQESAKIDRLRRNSAGGFFEKGCSQVSSELFESPYI